MIDFLTDKIRKQMYITGFLSIFINPFFIIRNALYLEIKKIALNIKGDILDFGCGSKPFENLFVNCDSYIGVDLIISGHNHKKSHIDYFYDGVTLPFNENQFDNIISFEVFEHIFNIDIIILELKRVLKPNGKMIISIPFVWDEHEIPYDFARYTSFGIKHILMKSGFKITQCIKTNNYFLAIAQLFLAYLFQHVFPKNKLFKYSCYLLFGLPLTLLFLSINTVLPKNLDLYCNCIIECTNNK